MDFRKAMDRLIQDMAGVKVTGKGKEAAVAAALSDESRAAIQQADHLRRYKKKRVTELVRDALATVDTLGLAGIERANASLNAAEAEYMECYELLVVACSDEHDEERVEAHREEVWKALREARLALDQRHDQLVSQSGQAANGGGLAVSTVGSSADTDTVDKMWATMNVRDVKLREFSGENSDYQVWWEEFEMMIDSNAHLTTKQKFWKFRQALTGAPWTLVKGYGLRDENYEQAKKVLASRYGSERLLINKAFDQILDKPAASGSTKASRVMFDEIKDHVQTLASHGVEVDDGKNAFVFISLTQRKLRPDLAKKWDTHLERKEIAGGGVHLATWTDYCSYIEPILSGEANIEGKGSKLKSQAKTPTTGANAQAETTGGTALYANRDQGQGQKNTRQGARNKSKKARKGSVSVSGQGPLKGCTICDNSEHHASKCPKVATLSVEQRRKAIQTFGGCFRCLTSGHMSFACPTKDVCSTCQGAHNTILHQDLKGSQ